MTLSPYVHFCHNLFIHSYPNKDYPQELVKITISFVKKHIITVVTLGTTGPNPTCKKENPIYFAWTWLEPSDTAH